MKSGNLITVPRKYIVPVVWKITSYPDLECIMGMKDMIDKLDRVLQLKELGQLLSYNTTFDLGKLNASPLIFRHAILKENPYILALFLVYERKLQQTQDH